MEIALRRRWKTILPMGKGDALTQAEQDEDAFNSWNRDITDYEQSLWDAYLFRLRRGRKSSEGGVPR